MKYPRLPQAEREIQHLFVGPADYWAEITLHLQQIADHVSRPQVDVALAILSGMDDNGVGTEVECICESRGAWANVNVLFENSENLSEKVGAQVGLSYEHGSPFILKELDGNARFARFSEIGEDKGVFAIDIE